MSSYMMEMYGLAGGSGSGGDDGGDSWNSSSVGNDSDDGDSSDGEAESMEIEGALGNLNALVEALPIRQGISHFYSGKSKSFTNLEVAKSSPIADIGKPEDGLTRKRKILLAHTSYYEQHLSRSGSNGRIAKRLASSSRSTSPPALPPLPPHGRRLATNEPSASPPSVSGSVMNNNGEEGSHNHNSN